MYIKNNGTKCAKWETEKHWRMTENSKVFNTFWYVPIHNASFHIGTIKIIQRDSFTLIENQKKKNKVLFYCYGYQLYWLISHKSHEASLINVIFNALLKIWPLKKNANVLTFIFTNQHQLFVCQNWLGCVRFENEFRIECILTFFYSNFETISQLWLNNDHNGENNFIRAKDFIF